MWARIAAVFSSTEASVPLEAFDGDAESPDSQLRAKYDIKEELGRGAFGRVYRAVRREDGIEVACKLIPFADSGSRERERIQREVEILQRVKHANLVELVRWGWHAGGRSSGWSLVPRPPASLTFFARRKKSTCS